MSRSLLACESDVGGHSRTTSERKGKQPRSRVQSDAESELEMSKYKRRFGSVGHGSVGHGSKLSVERPNSAMSEPAFSRKNRRQLRKEKSITTSEPPVDSMSNSRVRMQKISIQSLERQKRGQSKSTIIHEGGSTIAGSAPSVGHVTMSVRTPSAGEEGGESVCEVQPVGWQRWRLSRLLLSRYAGPAVLLLAGQVCHVFSCP